MFNNLVVAAMGSPLVLLRQASPGIGVRFAVPIPPAPEVVTRIHEVAPTKVLDMSVTEDCGYPPQLIPLLILLIAISFMASVYVTMPGGR